MNYRGAIALALAATAAFAGPEIPDPPGDDVVAAAEEALYANRRLEQRVLEPCDRETMMRSAIVPDELVGFLRKNVPTKSEESYYAGGSDFWLYSDTDVCVRFFPVEADANVRKALVAAIGKRVRISGRWAPLVRHSDEEMRQKKEWRPRIQHPSVNGEIPDPSSTWGGDFIADCVEELPMDDSDQPDFRYHVEQLGLRWPDSATRPTRKSGVLDSEVIRLKFEIGEQEITRYWLTTDDGQRIVVRYKLHSKMQAELAKLVDRRITVHGRWARLLTIDSSERSLAMFGPALKPHPTASSHVIAGGGIVADSLEEITSDPSTAPKPVDRP